MIQKSLWRPLVDVVQDLPLAVGDARTVSRTDLVEVEFIDSDSVRRSYIVRHNDKLRFYYLSRMTKEEMCVFKNFDSADVECKCESQHTTTMDDLKIANKRRIRGSSCCI